MMSDMMNEMHQMMMRRQMTEEHQRQMMDMMNEMAKMMQQMAGPKGRSMDKQNNHQLQEMEKRLDTMKNQMEQEGRS